MFDLAEFSKANTTLIFAVRDRKFSYIVMFSSLHEKLIVPKILKVSGSMIWQGTLYARLMVTLPSFRNSSITVFSPKERGGVFNFPVLSDA